MSYPQSQASQEVIEGQQFWRLFGSLESGADAYEMDVSASAFVIGPQSDIGQVRITYYDPSQPAKSSSFVVSVGNPFIGRVDAFSSNVFQVANTPARIIITPEDLYNNRWFPTVNGLDMVAFIRPRIDVLAYLAPPAAVAERRADFTTRGRLTIADRGAGTGISWFVVPFYRRKTAAITIRNRTAGAAGYVAAVSGINFTADGVAPYALPSDFIVAETPITLPAGGAIAPGPAAVTTFEVSAVTSGIFDYLLVSIAGAAIDGATLEDDIRYIINTSDEIL